MIDWNTINAATIRDLRSRVAELEEALTIVTRSKGATPEFDWESYYADTLAAAEKALVSPDVSATQREGIARRVAMGQPEAMAADAVTGDGAGDACSSRPGRFGETVEFVDGVTWWVPPEAVRYRQSGEARSLLEVAVDRSNEVTIGATPGFDDRYAAMTDDERTAWEFLTEHCPVESHEVVALIEAVRSATIEKCARSVEGMAGDVQVLEEIAEALRAKPVPEGGPKR